MTQGLIAYGIVGLVGRRHLPGRADLGERPHRRPPRRGRDDRRQPGDDDGADGERPPRCLDHRPELHGHGRGVGAGRLVGGRHHHRGPDGSRVARGPAARREHPGGPTVVGARPTPSGGIDASLEGLDTRLDGDRDRPRGQPRRAGGATRRRWVSSATASRRWRRVSTRASSRTRWRDIQMVIVVVLLLFTAWSVVPAVGALVVGLWLRRELERSGADALSRRPDHRST